MPNSDHAPVLHHPVIPILDKDFVTRFTTLRDGRPGLRAGLTCAVSVPKAVAGDDDLAATLDFIATDESIDRYNEVIELGGWELENYRKNPVVVDSHDYSSIARILGNSTELAVKDGQLHNRVKFSLDNPLGAMAYKMAKGGFIKSESVGFIPIDWEHGDESKGEPYRTFKKQELIEISLVAVPANPGATLGLALKSGAIAKNDLKDLADFLKPFCSDKAEASSNSGARGTGVNGAQLRQRMEQLLTPVRAALRRS